MILEGITTISKTFKTKFQICRALCGAAGYKLLFKIQYAMPLGGCFVAAIAVIKAGYKNGEYLDRLFRNMLNSGKLVLESEAQGLYSVAAGVVK